MALSSMVLAENAPVVKDEKGVIKGQVTTKDGYGVTDRNGHPVMIKNVK